MSKKDPTRPLPNTLEGTIAELGALLFSGYVRYQAARKRTEMNMGEAPRSPGETLSPDTKTLLSGDLEN